MQVTIITGAFRGIGLAISRDLNNLPHLFLRLSSKDLDIENYNISYIVIRSILESQFDDASIDQINLVLCAAQIGTANELDLINCEKVYRINVLGNLAVIKAASEFNVPMRIIWFAGGGAAFPLPEFFGYSLSKVAVVRAVENLSLTLKDTCIIALAPGAVDTDMLKETIKGGVTPRTKTDISEPVNFVRKFIESDSMDYNGCFLHVRDTLNIKSKDMFKLRRIE